eukprot:6214261-Pleurochrysis_carterae.AAC.2
MSLSNTDGQDAANALRDRQQPFPAVTIPAVTVSKTPSSTRSFARHTQSHNLRTCLTSLSSKAWAPSDTGKRGQPQPQARARKRSGAKAQWRESAVARKRSGAKAQWRESAVARKRSGAKAQAQRMCEGRAPAAKTHRQTTAQVSIHAFQKSSSTPFTSVRLGRAVCTPDDMQTSSGMHSAELEGPVEGLQTSPRSVLITSAQVRERKSHSSATTLKLLRRVSRHRLSRHRLSRHRLSRHRPYCEERRRRGRARRCSLARFPPALNETFFYAGYVAVRSRA